MSSGDWAGKKGGGGGGIVKIWKRKEILQGMKERKRWRFMYTVILTMLTALDKIAPATGVN